MGERDTHRIGVAIATHNNCDHARDCLRALLSGSGVDVFPVVVDDGSTDDSWEMLVTDFPEVCAIQGNGELWWTGGTNLAIETCLQAACDYILLLNPDVVLQPDTIGSLLAIASRYPRTIVAPVVVRFDNAEIVWWAGSRWQPLIPGFPLIWVNLYLFKSGTPIHDLPEEPFLTSEAHGRGVLVPSEVFERIGLYDNEHLPHYGADTDFSFRARRAGYNILIDSRIRVRLHVENTGLKTPDTLGDSWRGYWNYLTQRKNGEAVRVWWHVTRRHMPWYSALPSYLAILGWNSYRYWSRVLRRQFFDQGSQ